MLKVGILGASGRMGQALIQALEHAPGMTLTGAYSRHHLPKQDVPVFIEFSSVFSRSDVVIDFSSPEVLEDHLAQAVKEGRPIVVGTTGLSDEQKNLLVDASKQIGVVYSENYSVGAVIAMYLTHHLARWMDESFDVEISEIHHRHKIDSPSGTSLALGRAAARGRNIDFDQHAAFNRKGARLPGAIGFSVQRGGTVVGEHAVNFYGEDESLSLVHRGFSRQIYAQGALKAARWLFEKPAGLYSMLDVLDLHAGFKG